LLCDQIHRRRSRRGNLPGQIRNLQKVTDPRLTRNACPALIQPSTVARRLCTPFIGQRWTADLQSAAGPRNRLFAAARGPGGAEGQCAHNRRTGLSVQHQDALGK
jgi:hypothetical protein